MAEFKGRILVVDDDPVLLNLLVDTLAGIGYESVAASDGIQAVEILQREYGSGFDLMITDVKMPKMDGVGLLRRVRRAYPEMPVLFITGVAGPEIIAEASPDGYLSKPFRISNLEELIHRTLEQKDQPGQTGPHPRRVLINIPRETVRQTLAEALSATNYLPFSVADSAQAMRELESGTFDVMITGLNEPSTDSGVPAIDEIRRNHPTLKLVGFSESHANGASLAAKDKSTGKRSPSRTFDALLEPPFTRRDLVRLLDQTVNPPDSPA